MKLTWKNSCLAGSAAVAGLALAGLCALGPLAGDGSPSGWLLRCALLILFWLGYVILLVGVLSWLGGRIFGRGIEREKGRTISED